MGVNKVIYGGNTLVDLSETTVTPETMLKGVTAINAAGEAITGTLEVNTVEVPESVDFYDYDGTLLYSYTLEEAQALTELPAGATHDGLVFQGWNWSLENIKAHNRSIVVGALYTTDDATIRIHIHLEHGRTAPMLGIGVNGNVVIDWGDSKTGSVLTGTSLDTAQWASHTYDAAGDYTITLTVTGQIKFLGDSADGSYLLRHSSEADNRNAVYLNAVKKIELADGKVNIGDYAFKNCASLSTISMPEGLPVLDDTISAQYIGTGAFQNCKSLRSITLPERLRTLTSVFVSCTSLAIVAIPASLVALTEAAFNGCSLLKAVTLPDGMNAIGSSTFTACSKITSLHIPNVTVIGENAFANCDSLLAATIPSTVTAIMRNTFNGCSALKSVDISDSVTTISDYAFNGCKSLESIKIPETVTSIGAHAFYNCASLTEIAIPDGVTAINAHTFYGCSGLMSIEIPDSVTSIATNAFYGCKALEAITIPNNVTTIGSAAFQDCNSLNEITIPNGVTSIEASLFRGCKSLVSVVIPESVTSIGGYAFYGCSALESIAIPNDVTSIGTYAFHSCASLEKVEIPGGVASIGAYTFYGCSSLASASIVERKSKNLLKNTASTTTTNGVTFTVNSDGSITVNGTATATAFFNIPYTHTGAAESVVLTGCPSGGNGSTYMMRADKAGTIVARDYGSGATISAENIATVTYVAIRIQSGYTADNLVFHPMIRYASDTDSAYEAYKEPYSVTSIGSQAFQECGSLASFTFPNTITSIGSQAFNSCYGMRYYDFSDHASVPTLSTNVFINIAEDCEMLIPSSLYDTWSAATNWSTYANYMVSV